MAFSESYMILKCLIGQRHIALAVLALATVFAAKTVASVKNGYTRNVRARLSERGGYIRGYIRGYVRGFLA